MTRRNLPGGFPAIPGWWLVLALGLVAANSFAQFEVELTLDERSYLKYEPIHAHVRIRNFTGHTIGLFNHENKPWLSFYVSRINGEQVDNLGVEYDLQQVQIKGGDAVTIHVNLTPVYDIRAPGVYRVLATVYSATYNKNFKSPIREFDLLSGRLVMQETVAVSPTNQPPAASLVLTNATTPPPPEDLRTYVLVAKRVERKEYLYVRVENEARNIVHGVVRLGVLLGFAKPTIQVDRLSHAHILHQVGSRSYAYAEVSPDGKLMDSRVYSSMRSKPQLKTDEIGVVSVMGGELSVDGMEGIELITKEKPLDEVEETISPPPTE